MAYEFLPRETNDLIYEGIATQKPVLQSGATTVETNDLIYEGIATRQAWPLQPSDGETNDLIYEGIATTLVAVSCDVHSFETNDLIYEGIATAQTHPFRNHFCRNKRPDLRRDCDIRAGLQCDAPHGKQTT